MFRKPALSYHTAAGILFLLIAAEILFTTFLRLSFLSPVWNAVLLFVLSLVIGCFPLVITVGDPLSAQGRSHNARSFVKYAWWLAVAAGFVVWARQLHLNPVSVKDSDIIPHIEMLVKRHSNAVYPYQMITEWGYDSFPTYLPFTWGPFHLTEFMMIDYRYLVFGGWTLLLLLFATNCNRLFGAGLVHGYVFTLVQLLFWGYLLYADLSLMRTVELLMAAYYGFFLFSIGNGKWWIIASALLVCVLSRYSLLLWLPFFFLQLWNERGVVFVLKCMGAVLGGVLLLYILPFLQKDWQIFFRGMETYTIAGLAEWKGQSWQAPGEKPFQLFRGTGLAALFYETYHAPTEVKFEKFKQLHLLLTAFTTLLLAAWYWFRRNRLTTSSSQLITAAALKLYLTVFYGFIVIPYVYLYIVPLISSVFVLYYIRPHLKTSQSSVWQ